MLKIFILAVMISVLIVSGCGSGEDWNGTIKGRMTLKKWIASTNAEESVADGEGSAKIEHGMDYRVILSAETFLPDCNLVFDPSVGNRYELTGKDSFYKGETGASDKPCQGVVWKDKPPVDIYFDRGTVTVDGDGGYIVLISYRPLSDNSEHRTFILSGEKTGWF